MKIKIYVLISIISIGILACNSKEKPKNTKTNLQKKETKQMIDTLQSKADSLVSFADLWLRFPLKNKPLADTTNFNNFKEENFYNKQEVEALKLEKLYPNFYKNSHNYKAKASYKIDFSKDFHSAVITVLKGENEMESVLINYDLSGEIIDSKVISYDEIAEGWSRKHSKIEKSFLTIFDVFYGETTQIDTLTFHLNRLGYFNPIKTKFTNNIRPHDTIVLNRVYTDTIQFSNYNDDYDYKLIEGKKDGKAVVFIYNWDWQDNDKYHYKDGDLLKVNWKMDSIWIAGDGETIDFKERAISAERIATNKAPKSFVISCGSGCAMTYTEHNVIAKDNAIEVVFKVEMYINEAKDDEHFETYLFSCNESKNVKQLNLKDGDDYPIENKLPALQKNLRSYANRLCQETLQAKNGNTYNKSIKYVKFTPNAIPNLTLKNYQINNAYLLDSNKVVAAYDNTSNPDTDKDWGDKLLLLNNKNEVLFESFGVGDLYLFEPHFYKNKESGKIIIICQLGYEYFFGGEAFIYENGDITYIGTLDIESNKHDISLIDIVEIHEKDDEIHFTFNSDSLILNPGSKDIIIKNNGVKYVYINNELVFIK